MGPSLRARVTTDLGGVDWVQVLELADGPSVSSMGAVAGGEAGVPRASR